MQSCCRMNNDGECILKHPDSGLENKFILKCNNKTIYTQHFIKVVYYDVCKVYVGQTGRVFEKDAKNTGYLSGIITKFVKIRTTLARRRHTFFPLESIMAILTFYKKHIHSNAIEIYWIYNKTTLSNQLKAKRTIRSDKILKIIINFRRHWHVITTQCLYIFSFPYSLVSFHSPVLPPQPPITSLAGTFFDFPSDDIWPQLEADGCTFFTSTVF